MFGEWFALNANATVLLSIALMWLSGFLATRLTKLFRLPNVVGYILAGIAIGPGALNLVPAEVMPGLDFITDVSLSFLAFGFGRYAGREALRRSGGGVIVLTLCETLICGTMIALALHYWLGLSLAMALLLGAIGSATAPTSTLMSIRHYHAKGPFVNTLISVAVLDNAAALIAFSSVAAVVAAAGPGNRIDPVEAARPLLQNVAAIALGAALGALLGVLIHERRSKDHRLALTCTAIFLMAGLCAGFGISPLLGSMVMGTVYANSQGDRSLFKQLGKVTPPIQMIFYVLAGMLLDVKLVLSATLVGAGYLLVRVAGKYVGAFFGGCLTRARTSVRAFLGLALLPQAGVSIGLALLAQRMLPGDQGRTLYTIILCTSVLFEMIGPAASKAALRLSGSIEGMPDSSQRALFALFQERSGLGKHEDLVYIARERRESPVDSPDTHKAVEELLDDMNEAEWKRPEKRIRKIQHTPEE